jgi:virginiamycin B lyase
MVTLSAKFAEVAKDNVPTHFSPNAVAPFFYPQGGRPCNPPTAKHPVMKKLPLTVFVLFASALASAAQSTQITPENILTEYPLPLDHSYPTDITSSKDGSLWFTEEGAGGRKYNKIGRITTNGVITEYDVPGRPSNIVAAPDGSMWFLSHVSDFDDSRERPDRICRIKLLSDGFVELKEYTLPRNGPKPRALAFGREGTLWYTRGTKIGRMTADGGAAEFPIPGSSTDDILGKSGLGGAGNVTLGTDGAIWCTYRFDTIVRFANGGDIKVFRLPNSEEHYLQSLWPDVDGAIWYVDSGTKRIGRISSQGTVTEIKLKLGSSPIRVVAGPDGAMWYTDANYKVGRIELPDQKITEIPIAKEAKQPGGIAITVGPDNAIWITLAEANKVCRLTTKRP